MALSITEQARKNRLEKIKAVVEAHDRTYLWGRVDCISLVEGTLFALGITPCLRKHECVKDTHEKTIAAALAKGSVKDVLCDAFDGIADLERVESPYDWSPGMVGLTPENEEFHLGFRKVKYPCAWPAIVDHEGKPRMLTEGRGMQAVSALWPRWKMRRL